MPDQLAFSTVEAPATTMPESCSLCKTATALLSFHVSSDDKSFQKLDGLCCLRCGMNLLKALEGVARAKSAQDGSSPG